MTDIANDRNLAKEEVNRLMKYGSLLAPEALKEKLVDGMKTNKNEPEKKRNIN